jgi:hypothetical protein
MAITALPTPPSRQDPDNFSARGDAFMAALPTFATEANTLAADVESAAATAAADAVAAASSGVLAVAVQVTGDQTVGGVKTFSSPPVMPGNATSALQAVPKQQAESIAASVAASYFPVGTRLPFAQASAPTGWTQDTTDAATNRMLRVVNTAGGSIGGSHSPILNNVVPAHTHSITTGAMSANASHSHTVNDPTHSHSFTAVLDVAGTRYPGGGVGNSQAGTTSAASTGISLNASNIDHTHWGTTDNGSSSTNWAPRYIDLIICSKN